MKSKEKKFRKGMVAMTQIFILVIGIFAFTWLIGGITSVSAGGDEINLNDCASGFSSGGKNYVGVCKDYGTLKSTYAKTQCPIDYSGSVYIANHCGGPSTTQYCCATLKTDEKKDSSEGLDFVRTAEEIAIQQMMAKIEALKESIRKTLPVETPAG